jgi:cyclic pyranopterin phosphate synthase
MSRRKRALTHLDAANRPTMVDVGTKTVTRREAVAEAIVALPATVARELRATGHRTRKGPVFDTAVIAGVLAAKRTHELVPFCHPLPIDHCSLDVRTAPRNRLVIEARVAAQHRTGVEMEALTAATIAALTVYDMCKALSHDIRIERVRLLEKRGGRRDIRRRRSRS